MNRFRKNIIIFDEEQDEINETINEFITQQRYILLLLLFQQCFIFIMVKFSLNYTYQICIQFYANHKITIYGSIIALLILSDIFKSKLKNQPQSTIAFILLTIQFCFLAIVFSSMEIQMLFLTNIISIISFICSSFFQNAGFQYYITYIWILITQSIFISLQIIINGQIILNQSIIFGFCSIVYCSIILYIFIENSMNDIEKYIGITGVLIYSQFFKIIFLLIEAASGEIEE